MAMKLPSCWRSSYGFSSPSLLRFLASTSSLRRNVSCSLVPLCHKATAATLPSPFSYSSPSPSSSSSSSSSLRERHLAFASPTEKSHGFSSLSPSSQSESSSSSSNKNYLSLPDKELLAQCEVDTFRASGPGGQHRNKTESAVRLRHLPTGLVGQASDDRSQHKNRVYALERLRQEIALKVRRPVDLTSYEIPPELQRIIPKRKNEKKNSSQIGPNHQDYPQGLQALLDLVWATNGVISDAASTLGLSTGVFSKVITSDKALLHAVNELRASKGFKPIRDN